MLIKAASKDNVKKNFIDGADNDNEVSFYKNFLQQTPTFLFFLIIYQHFVDDVLKSSTKKNQTK
jgi:hypothetical protein